MWGMSETVLLAFTCSYNIMIYISGNYAVKAPLQAVGINIIPLKNIPVYGIPANITVHIKSRISLIKASCFLPTTIFNIRLRNSSFP